MARPVRLRVAPSPTGALHVGTARTAIFNYLYARQMHAPLLLRIEDTDTERSKQEFVDDIRAGYDWLGIEFDGVVFQSHRTALYEEAIRKLLGTGRAFYCSHPPRSGPPGVPHVCDDRDKNLTEGIIRFRNDATEPVVFNDVIRGEIRTEANTIGDFAIAVSPTRPLFLLANVVDDAEMEISHVIRGEDHITNVPKQMLIGSALGAETPVWAHLPLILGADRSKLSKRHGAKPVIDYKEEGYLPDALFNFLALVGWHPDTDIELMDRDTLIKEFRLERVQKGGGIFDVEKLQWMNAKYISTMPIHELTRELTPRLVRAGLIREHWERTADPFSDAMTPHPEYQFMDGAPAAMEHLERIIAIERPRMKTLRDITGAVYLFSLPDYDASILSWKGTQPVEETASLLSQLRGLIGAADTHYTVAAEWEAHLLPFAEIHGKGNTLWPLRVALSGMKGSPSPFELLSVLSKTESLRRIDEAIKKLTA